jgi:hypothetical protein
MDYNGLVTKKKVTYILHQNDAKLKETRVISSTTIFGFASYLSAMVEAGVV